jgi:hypothetical protein
LDECRAIDTIGATPSEPIRPTEPIHDKLHHLPLGKTRRRLFSLDVCHPKHTDGGNVNGDVVLAGDFVWILSIEKLTLLKPSKLLK